MTRWPRRVPRRCCPTEWRAGSSTACRCSAEVPLLWGTSSSAACCPSPPSTTVSTSPSSGGTGRWAGSWIAPPSRSCCPDSSKRLIAYGPDLVVSVFATGASAAVHLKQARPDLATVVFMTDSFAYGMWVHQGTDLFLVTSDLAAASVRRYYPEARVECGGGPRTTRFLHGPQSSGRPGLAEGPPRCPLHPPDVGGVGIGAS